MENTNERNVKVLVADENVEQTTECCQYLSNHDHMLKIISANTGIETLEKYNTLKTEIEKAKSIIYFCNNDKTKRRNRNGLCCDFIKEICKRQSLCY